jgi:RHS repeat-associated protein
VNEYTSINGGGFQVPNPTYDDILLRQGYGGQDGVAAQCNLLPLASSSLVSCVSITDIRHVHYDAILLRQGYGGQDGVAAQCNLLPLESSSLVSCVSIKDIHNRLRTSSQISNPQSQISLVYDPLGRLVWTRTTTPGQTAVDEVWSWSGWTLLTREVLQGSTALDTFRYTWGPDLSGSLEGAGGVGGLLSIEHAAGNSSTWDIRHVHYDANGNVIALTNSTGNISARYRYSPFGELITSQDLDSSGWNERNVHRFSTKPEVAGTGLLYYGYRWYDPATGRWPSRDPIEEVGGMNMYGFVRNNSVRFFDILGREPYEDDPNYTEGVSPPSEEELIIGEIGFWDGLMIADTPSTARDCAEGMPGGWGGEGDAVRHCTWLCEMSQRIGYTDALSVGQIHESTNPPPDLPAPPIIYSSVAQWHASDRLMDEWNNKFGAKLGVDKCLDCCEACKEALGNWDLFVNENSGYTFE